MTITQWRPTPGIPGYEVSEDGDVRFASTQRILERTGGRPSLCGVQVSRLVCEAFNGPPFPGALCRHLNDNPSDNRSKNLAWGTAQDNTDDAIRNGRQLGRPPKPPGTHLVQRSIRLTRAHWAKIDAAGLPAQRRRIEETLCARECIEEDQS